ncbi:DUF397 domain-containing protein [Streptomyces sp. NPDC003077]|uniref:DUF397 domain-containing protein n=1 Tax=Streptomyces sp. NPDC003077 TaxID=3154443 RepID=UPI0033BAA78D
MELVAMQWQKSSFSTDAESNCVEVAAHEGRLLLRESDIPAVTVTVSRIDFAALLAGIKGNQLVCP